MIRLNLEGELSIHGIEELYRDLIAAYEGKGKLLLNCKNLTSMDTAAFQMLVALKKSLGDRRLDFEKVPPAIREMADLLGLKEFLKLGQ
jgi:anti-anti-sigma factor